MNRPQFFKVYLAALKKALENDEVNHGFLVKGPDWYIENVDTRNEIDVFIEDHFTEFSNFFTDVSLYFDARSHNFQEIDLIPIDDFRLRILEQMRYYSLQYGL